MSRLKNGWFFKNNLYVKTNIILTFFIVKIHLTSFMVNRKILKKRIDFKIDRNKSKDKSKVWEFIVKFLILKLGL